MEIFGRMGYSKKDIRSRSPDGREMKAPFQSAAGSAPAEQTDRKKRCKKVKK